MYSDVKISDLLGKTLTGVSGKVGDDEMKFTLTDGRVFVLYHAQDCCECVDIEDICGDLTDLVGSPLIQAEESTNSKENPDGAKVEDYQESFTWTFYRLATDKGAVVIRWYGSSNGYYSESVDCMWDETNWVPIVESVERDLNAERERAERAINCISAIKLHQQMIAGSTNVKSAIMTIINDWEIEELKRQKELK
jgi:hypothetical protein